MSRVGWRAEPDPHYSGCYIYRNTNMHSFPTPLSFYQRDAPLPPLALAANQTAPAPLATPGGAAALAAAQPRGF